MHRMTHKTAPSHDLQRPECSEEPKETLIQQLDSFEVSDHRHLPSTLPLVSQHPSCLLSLYSGRRFEHLKNCAPRTIPRAGTCLSR